VNPVTHFLVSWSVANVLPASTRRERTLVALAGVVPDVDGVGIVPDFVTRLLSDSPTAYFHAYHHKLHCVAWAACVGVLAAALAGPEASFKRRGAVGLFALATFHLHLLCDVLGARGPDGDQWPIPYLLPFSDAWQWTWSGQWALNAWPNFVITGILLVIAGVVAVKRGRSPVEVVSARADAAVVETLGARFGRA
jgi:inner membrane protein